MSVPARAGTVFAGPVFTGTGALARLAFRRDRIMLPAWVYVITALIASNSYSLNPGIALCIQSAINCTCVTCN